MTRTLLIGLGLLLGWALLSPGAEAKRQVFPKPGYILRIELRGASKERLAPPGAKAGSMKELEEKDDNTLSTIEVEVVPGQRFFARTEQAEETRAVEGWVEAFPSNREKLEVDLRFSVTGPGWRGGKASLQSSTGMLLSVGEPVSFDITSSNGVAQTAEGPVQFVSRRGLRLTLLRGVPDASLESRFP